MDFSVTRVINQCDVSGLTRLEADRGTRGNIEPFAKRHVPIKIERFVGLEKMIVRVNLDRTVTRIRNR